MNLDEAIAFYELCEKVGAETKEQREVVADAMLRKIPQEHIEAMLEGKRVLFINPKKESNE